MTKEERAQIALKKRQEEVEAKRKLQEEERKKQREFLSQGKLLIFICETGDGGWRKTVFRRFACLIVS